MFPKKWWKSIFSVFSLHFDLVVTWKPTHKREHNMTNSIVNKGVYVWKGKIIFRDGIIKSLTFPSLFGMVAIYANHLDNPPLEGILHCILRLLLLWFSWSILVYSPQLLLNGFTFRLWVELMYHYICVKVLAYVHTTKQTHFYYSDKN